MMFNKKTAKISVRSKILRKKYADEIWKLIDWCIHDQKIRESNILKEWRNKKVGFIFRKTLLSNDDIEKYLKREYHWCLYDDLRYSRRYWKKEIEQLKAAATTLDVLNQDDVEVILDDSVTQMLSQFLMSRELKGDR